ncbi:MAG: DUF3426 domain-containing protein [Gammaproteobacteria bacterium]|nr:DUF3426 domain-containing protein [Gammaproteobacteria bacterium]
MYTECPNCHTFFKVSSSQLRVAEGKVRCGNCNEVFNAVNSLLDEVPASVLNKETSQETQYESFAAQESEIAVSEADEASISAVIPTDETAGSETEDSSLSDLAGGVGLSSLSDLDDLSGISDLSDVAGPETKAPESEVSARAEVASAEESLAIDDLTLSDLSIDSDIPQDKVSENVAPITPSAGGTLSDLSDINRDIDNALDGLFDEDEDLDTSSSSLQKPKNVIDDIQIANTPAEQEEGVELGDLNLDEELSSVAPQSVPAMAAQDNVLDDLSLEGETGGRLKDTSQQSTPDELDLGDSLLNSETLDFDDNDWSPEAKKEGESSLYSGDSYILEEMDEDERRTGMGVFAKLFWSLLIFSLIIILIGQFIYLKRDTLVKYPQIQPVLEAECKLIGMFMPCEMPVRKAPEKIELVDRNVVSHPNAENALLITTTIRNNADFVQPYPLMILTFSDINEKVVARRVFTPEEYLSKDVDIEKGMPVGVPIKVILEIVDPGEEAVNFQFDFK